MIFRQTSFAKPPFYLMDILDDVIYCFMFLQVVVAAAHFTVVLCERFSGK